VVFCSSSSRRIFPVFGSSCRVRKFSCFGPLGPESVQQLTNCPLVLACCGFRTVVTFCGHFYFGFRVYFLYLIKYMRDYPHPRCGWSNTGTNMYIAQIMHDMLHTLLITCCKPDTLRITSITPSILHISHVLHIHITYNILLITFYMHSLHTKGNKQARTLVFGIAKIVSVGNDRYELEYAVNIY
jgi:hypothetical protein